MKPIDLKDLINGLITVIIITLSVGQYGKLRDFAKKEFVRSMTARSSFGRSYGRDKGGTRVPIKFSFTEQ